jgi:hypothetical protein
MINLAKTDGNHVSIKQHLIRNGYRVYNLFKAGEGIPDLLVLEPDALIWVLLEVKMPGEGLRGKQIEFFAETAGAPRHVVSSQEEAVEIMAQYRPRKGR